MGASGAVHGQTNLRASYLYVAAVLMSVDLIVRRAPDILDKDTLVSADRAYSRRVFSTSTSTYQVQ